MPAAELRTLGAFAFTIDGRAIARPSTQKARALLAFLAMRGGKSVAREAVIETFWPESDADNARQSLKTALWSIRRTLRDAGVEPESVFSADNFTVVWHVPTHVDALDFERIAATAGNVLEAYTGDFLPGDYDEWASAQRERFMHLLETSLARALERREGGVNAAQRLLELDPFSEAAYATLIEAEIAANRIVAAQTLRQRFRAVLRENGLEATSEFDRRFASLDTTTLTQPAGNRFLGRAREMALFERALHAEEATTTIVHADAGFGKTALLEQFRRRAVESGRTVVSLAVRSEPHGFGGWEDVYRDRTGASVEELVVQRGASQASAMARAILATLPAGSCVLIDDALHLQGESAFVAAAIAEGAREAGVHLVFTTRPEGLAKTLDIAPEALDVALDGLSEDDVRIALAERGEDGDALARRLFARTRGHPLFLQRLLERHRGGEDQIDMPASVRGLIQARLGERGEDASSIATLLALDRNFGSDELAGILGWGEERVLDAIDDLLALGIVRETEGVAHLQFAHDLVMEVAREALSPQRRRRLHQRAAELLEGATTIATLARSAEHHAGAGDAMRAAERYVHCSEAAFAAFEPRNAVLLAERAREQATHLDRTPEAKTLSRRASAALVKALNAASDPKRADVLATAAIAEAKEAGDERELLEMVLLRMRARMRTSDLAGIEEDAQGAMTLARRIGSPTSFAEAALGMLQSALQRLDRDRALEYGKLAFESAIEGGDADLAVFVASEYLHAQALFWRFSDALDTLRRSDELLANATRTTEPNFQYSAAQLMHLLARYDEAERRVERGLSLIRDGGLASGRYIPDRQRTIAILTNMRAFIALEQRNWKGAWDAASAFAENPATQIPALRPHVVDVCARVLLARNEPGDTDRAAELLDSLDAASLVDDTNMYAVSARARIAARRGNADAVPLIDAAIATTEKAAGAAGLDVDVIFAELANAAEECGAGAQAQRAANLATRYRAMRREAAGDAWGGAA